MNLARTTVDLSPDFKVLNVMNSDWVPEGTPVTVQEWSDQTKAPAEKNGGLRYVWKGGKPVPDYDPKLVEKIRRQVKQSMEEDQKGK